MDTYTLTLKRRFWFNRKLKKVKANFFPDDINPGYDHSFYQVDGKPVQRMLRQNSVKYMMVVFEDERKLVVNLEKYLGYEVSKELFFIQAKKAEEESQGQVKVA